MSRHRQWAAAALAISAIVALAACKKTPPANDTPDALASPQAKAEPAPLADLAPTASATTTATRGPDAGPPPVALRGDREVAVDIVPKEWTPPVIMAPTKDGGAPPPPPPPKDTKELWGYTLQASLHPSDLPAAPKSPEVSVVGIEAARRKTEARLVIDFSQARARIILQSGAFVLPVETELRARADRFGHIVLLPHDGHYRVAAPGALRALLGERRLDVAPLSAAELTRLGDGPRRVGLETTKIEVTTRAAKATFELATLKDAGEGGALVCRALLDLVNAPPSTPLCGTDQVPLHAELRWTTKGSMTFDVQSVTRRHDIAMADVAAPPPNVSFASTPPPERSSDTFLSKAELVAMRLTPVEVPVVQGDAQAAVDNGLTLVNTSDELRVAVLDGIPIAWLAPGSRETIATLLHGRYVLQWRTFLGDAFEAPQIIVVPSVVENGDAGAP